jgi:hypothetical protein
VLFNSSLGTLGFTYIWDKATWRQWGGTETTAVRNAEWLKLSLTRSLVEADCRTIALTTSKSSFDVVEICNWAQGPNFEQINVLLARYKAEKLAGV